MQLADATALIRDAGLDEGHAAAWADLGCGAGTFTLALAACLAPGSRITAVDRSVYRIPGNDPVRIDFLQADFENDNLPLSGLDGILMANSLHYVARKAELLDKIGQCLAPGGRLLIIEYDTMQANPWVPYPVDTGHLQELLSVAGFADMQYLGERQSVYRQGKMYACIFKRRSSEL